MVQASGPVNAAYPAILKAIFVRRSILSLSAAGIIPGPQASTALRAMIAIPPPGETHEIVGKTPAGMPILRRRRFALF